mmetsp:Transcript_76165/g.149175  ORF Transcript_76165/g.149175 Transcript_76165/m.149175 type:complete len:250 (-) Transcript_76165:1215-1964(-)
MALSCAAIAPSTSPFTSRMDPDTWYTSDMLGRQDRAFSTAASASPSFATTSASDPWPCWASWASCCACEMRSMPSRSKATTWSGFLATHARMSDSDCSMLSGLSSKSWLRCIKTSTESGHSSAALVTQASPASRSPLSTCTPLRMISTRPSECGWLAPSFAATWYTPKAPSRSYLTWWNKATQRKTLHASTAASPTNPACAKKALPALSVASSAAAASFTSASPPHAARKAPWAAMRSADALPYSRLVM